MLLQFTWDKYIFTCFLVQKSLHWQTTCLKLEFSMVPHTQHVQYLKENFLHLIPFCYIFLISILCFYTSPSACIALMNKKPMDCCHYNHSVRLLPKRSFVLSVKSLVSLSGKKITLSWEKFQLPLVHVVIVVLILTLTSTWNSFYSIISVL